MHAVVDRPVVQVSLKLSFDNGWSRWNGYMAFHLLTQRKEWSTVVVEGSDDDGSDAIKRIGVHAVLGGLRM